MINRSRGEGNVHYHAECSLFRLEMLQKSRQKLRMCNYGGILTRGETPAIFHQWGNEGLPDCFRIGGRKVQLHVEIAFTGRVEYPETAISKVPNRAVVDIRTVLWRLSRQLSLILNGCMQ